MTGIVWANTELPSKIKCVAANVTSSSVKQFDVTGLNTGKPDSTIVDTSLLEMGEDGGTTIVSFSNECDNSYSLSFYTQDLIDLKNKKVNKVRGVLNYADVELSETTNSEESETSLLTCTLE
jgi:hypothetical protein